MSGMDFKTETQLRNENGELWSLIRAERAGYADMLASALAALRSCRQVLHPDTQEHALADAVIGDI